MNPLFASRLSHARRLVDQGQLRAALEAYTRFVEEFPGFAEGWYEYAWLLRRDGAAEQAMSAYARALAAGIRGPEEIHLNRAVILSEDLARPEAALAELEHALRLRPHYPAALLNLGKLHEDLGNPDTAATLYAQLSESDGSGDLGIEALARLVQIDPAREATPARLARLESEAQRSERPGSLRSTLWFALARCHEVGGAIDAMFDALHRANRLAAEGGPPYSPATLERHVDAMLASPSPAARPAAAAPAPLIICGMFRSGSTLLEQVLNAHSKVAAGGELPFFPRMAAGALAAYATGATLPARAAENIRGDYQALLARISAASGKEAVRLVSDKRPDNVLLLGLIRQVLPGARILLTRRNPMDTGLSVYQQHLSQSQAPYSTDLASIGHFQRQVHRITEHFSDSCPGQVRVFDYDAFVGNPEAELRALFGWLQLDFEPGCLRFHDQRNRVATASHAQVRRPLYRDSSGRWLRYARHLEPLSAALGPLNPRHLAPGHGHSP